MALLENCQILGAGDSGCNVLAEIHLVLFKNLKNIFFLRAFNRGNTKDTCPREAKNISVICGLFWIKDCNSDTYFSRFKKFLIIGFS